jgi:hypothetical protein
MAEGLLERQRDGNSGGVFLRKGMGMGEGFFRKGNVVFDRPVQ